MFVAISGCIDLKGGCMNNFCGASTTAWVKESGKWFLYALYGVWAKDILQPTKVTSKESCEENAWQLYGDNWCTLRGLNFRDLLDLGAIHEGLPKLCQWHKS